MKKRFILVLFAAVTATLLGACEFFDPIIPVGAEQINSDEPGEKTVFERTAEYDYYADTFGLPSDHGFQTLVYNDLIALISEDIGGDTNRPASSRQKPKGDYAILFGNADAATKAVIGEIYAAAKAQEVKKIYFFDPQLDGGLSRGIIGELTGTDASSYTYGGETFAYGDFNVKDYYYNGETLLKRINRSFTSGDTLTADDAAAPVTPLLIQVRRAQYAASGLSGIDYRVESPFIGKPEGYTLTAADLGAYKAELNNLFAGIRGSEGDFDPFLALSAPDTAGVTENTHLIVNKYFKSVSYAELIKLLDAPGERVVLFGGAGSPNADAIFGEVHTAAVHTAYDRPIYVYSPIITATYGAPDSRGGELAADGNNSGTHALLYANLITRYFPDFASRWNSERSASRNALELSGVSAKLLINGKSYAKAGAANLILYNKAAGGIIDSFESELTRDSETGDITAEGAGTGAVVANDYVSAVFEDLLGKAGIAQAFIDAGYTFSADTVSDVRRTLITAENADATTRLKLFTYYDARDYQTALSALSGSGLKIVVLNSVGFYAVYTSFDLTAQIIEAVRDGSIYTEGVDLAQEPPAEDHSGHETGGDTTAPSTGGAAEEDC
ncbi:MAG: hypothetical protein LBS99_04925 [Clostridiales bacterium]|jgi:hypothetical protein|nr:hypothetical protein [Clostridiales bacterium]